MVPATPGFHILGQELILSQLRIMCGLNISHLGIGVQEESGYHHFQEAVAALDKFLDEWIEKPHYLLTRTHTLTCKVALSGVLAGHTWARGQCRRRT